MVARFEQVKETFWGGSTVGVQPRMTDEMVVGAEGVRQQYDQDKSRIGAYKMRLRRRWTGRSR